MSRESLVVDPRLFVPLAACQVEVLWQCAEAKLEGSITMKRQKGPAPLYTAPWESEVSCGPPSGVGGTNVISLQVNRSPGFGVTLVT